MEESRGPMMKMYDEKDASASNVAFTTTANIIVHANAAPDPNEPVDFDKPRNCFGDDLSKLFS
jgi:hypothetical protein